MRTEISRSPCYVLLRVVPAPVVNIDNRSGPLIGTSPVALERRDEFYYCCCADTYEQLRDSDTAFDALQKAGQFSSKSSKLIALSGYLFGKLGRTAEAREVLT